jgi:hypothetical protein
MVLMPPYYGGTNELQNTPELIEREWSPYSSSIALSGCYKGRGNAWKAEFLIEKHAGLFHN